MFSFSAFTNNLLGLLESAADFGCPVDRFWLAERGWFWATPGVGGIDKARQGGAAVVVEGGCELEGLTRAWCDGWRRLRLSHSPPRGPPSVAGKRNEVSSVLYEVDLLVIGSRSRA